MVTGGEIGPLRLVRAAFWAGNQLATTGKPGFVDVTDTWGLNARVGYRARRWFAFEVQWEWMENFQTTFAGKKRLSSLRA